jgi:AraC family transcriptional regulator of arabinose operon
VQHWDETPHPLVSTIVTGHFNQGSGYRAWRTRGTDDWLLIRTMSGMGRFGFTGGEIFAEPGDWVLLRPGTLHDYGVEPSLKRWELLWTHFQARVQWLPLLSWPVIDRGMMRLRITDSTLDAKATDRFLQTHQLATGSLRGRDQFAMNALEEVLLWCDQSNLRDKPGVDSRVQEAIDYFIRNLHEKPTITDASETVGLSVSRFSHLFKSETGTTPQQFLEGQRIERAAQLLLRTTFSIKQIATAVGFDSPFYFSLRFKSRMRQSPKAFRDSAPDDQMSQ